jgi:hypothetical protein
LQQRGSTVRKILIGIALALAFVMISLTLVDRSLPKPTGPAESQAARAAAIAEIAAPVVTVARVAPGAQWRRSAAS